MAEPHPSLVRALRAAQHECGHLTPDVLRALADRLDLPLYRLQEVVSFFPQTFRTTTPAATEFLVCRDMSCYVAGAPAVADALRTRHGAAVHEVHCLGRCDRAPAVAVETFPRAARRADPGAVADRAARSHAAPHNPFRFGTGTPTGPAVDAGDEPHAYTDSAWQIDVYADKRYEPFEAVRRLAALTARERADQLLGALETASLFGMGGAGVPAARKWKEVLRQTETPKYVIANGDESEPGGFKDRELMRRAPHLIVEGVALAGLLLGAKRGYVYVRHEYPAQMAALREAVADLADADVYGAEPRFPIEVYESPGGYVCGEQSALIEAIEDKRAQPRPKPPDIATNGLWDCPTLLNNVETFAWVPAIFLRGGAWYRDLGYQHPDGGPKYKGMRFFSVSGDVAHPGVFEVPVGAPLGNLLTRAGGLRTGRTLKAVAVGGASGGFMPTVLPDERERKLVEMPLDINAFRPDKTGCRGSMLATGLVVFDDTRNVAELAANCLRFFRDESCGKCVPCRIGTEKLLQVGTGMLGKPAPVGPDPARRELADLDPALGELAEAMEAASICSLGISAPAPLASLLRFFPADTATAKADPH